MEQKVSEEQRKLIGAIRHQGSQFNNSLPQDRLRSETLRIKGLCEELLALLGGHGE